MDVRELILKRLEKNRELKAAEIVKATGFSRTYVNRFFQELRDEGRIVLLGKANRAHYILATEKDIKAAWKKQTYITRLLQNKELAEDIVLDDIKKKTGIFIKIPKNISGIVSYAFLEMLNNAIEHSCSETIRINMQKDKEKIIFNVSDRGIGIFNNIMDKKNLKSEIEAIQDLLKGKQSTAPQVHSGEGIFFTSKVAEVLVIQSSHKKLIFNNLLQDIFIRDTKTTVGTKVTFSISLNTKKRLEDIFRQYTDDSFDFSKTQVRVRLYKMGTEYISRSQARRILAGLDKFKTIVLNFKDVETIGQGFADEVFRVWKSQHPDISVITQEANENIGFMIKRAKTKETIQ